MHDFSIYHRFRCLSNSSFLFGKLVVSQITLSEDIEKYYIHDLHAVFLYKWTFTKPFNRYDLFSHNTLFLKETLLFFKMSSVKHKKTIVLEEYDRRIKDIPFERISLVIFPT